VHLLDKYNRILQNARNVHSDSDIRFGPEERNPVKNIFTAKENKHYIFIHKFNHSVVCTCTERKISVPLLNLILYTFSVIATYT